MTLIKYSTEKQMTTLIIAADGSPATGKTVNIAIRRSSDGTWWEGTGSTWEAAKQNNLMTEISDGLYYYDFTSTGVGAVDNTFVAYYQEATIPAYGVEEFMATDIYTNVDDIEDDTIDIISEVASHALEDSTSDSEILSAVGNLSVPGQSTTQSMIASHALEDGYDESATQSEVASHALEQSEVLSVIDKNVDDIETTTDSLYAMQILIEGTVAANGSTTVFETNLPEDDDHWNDLYIVMTDGALNSKQVRRISDFVDVDGVVTVSQPFEVAVGSGDAFYLTSRYLDPTYYENITSEIASHALEQSTPLSEAISALAERDIDLSELTSFALEQNTEEGLTQSEIASHVVERSEVLSTAESSLQLHDTDIKALQRVTACPDLMYVPFDATQLNGDITAIATTIPVDLSDNLLSEGMVLIGTEYITYTGVSGGSLTGCTRGEYGSSGAIHLDDSAVYQSILYPIRLTIKDNEGNMLAPDSAPTITIDDWKGTEEVSATAMTLISTGVYGYNYIIDFGDMPENKIFIFTHVIDGITATTRHEVVVIEQIASVSDVTGSGTGDYVCDQAGWYDTNGIKTAWTDVAVGIVEDADTGAPLDDAYVTAYPIIGGETKYSGRPTAQAITRSNGTWLMNLDAGTYTFVIEKEGFRIVGDGVVERTVG